MNLFYKRDGMPYEEPGAIIKWGRDFSDPKIKIVKQETLPNGLFVSTVWLGLDHNFYGSKPLIFETMVFGDEDEIQRRYHTEVEALKGHEEIVAEVSQLPPKTAKPLPEK